MDDQLRMLKFDVLSAETPEHALEALTASTHQQIDVLLIEQSVVDSELGSLVDSLRSDPAASPVHIVVTTARNKEETEIALSGTPVEAVLAKPATPSMLLDTIGGLYQDESAIRRTFIPKSVAPSIPNFAGTKILLVEDDPLNQQVASELLQLTNAEITLAENGQAALDAIKSGNVEYDLILMDLQMPVMDGFTAAREILALPNKDHTIILAMTANAMNEDKAQCLAAGMKDHIAKPIEPRELWKTLSHWIKLQKPTRENSPAQPLTQDEPPTLPQPVLTDVDVELGLRAVLNNLKLYWTLLEKYVTTQSEFISNLQAALSNGENETAERLAHTLKSTSGQIGALNIQTQAKALEQQIINKANADEIRETIETIGGMLHPVLTEVSAQLASVSEIRAQLAKSKPQRRMRFDTQDFERVSQQLIGLLAGFDIESLKVASENSRLLRAALGKDHTKFLQLIKAFDYEAAKELLEQRVAELRKH